MPNVHAAVFIATSLDGYIARINGDIDWLPTGADSASEDYGYADFIKTIDAVVMGRLTYEKVLTLGPWPYTKPVVVLSSRKLTIPKELSKKVSTMAGKVDAILGHLESLGMTRIYVDGGATIQRFLADGAIQRLIITRVPTLIGKGLPLFGFLDRDVALKHVETRSWPSGLVQSEYEVLPPKKRLSRKKPRVSKATKARKR